MQNRILLVNSLVHNCPLPSIGAVGLIAPVVVVIRMDRVKLAMSLFILSTTTCMLYAFYMCL